MDNFLKEILPYFYTLIIAILTYIIKSLGDVVIAYIGAKKQDVIAKVGKTKYEQEKAVAYDIWNIVDEHFRITEFVGDKIQLKINMFNDLLLKKLPYLKQEDIDHLRQSIAGDINKYKDILKTPVEGDTPTPTE